MKYSRQREKIREYVLSVTAHPTAEMVYDAVREEIPTISRGTVYRNLNGLVDSGEISAIDLGDGTTRYDGNLTPHMHFVCRSCGRIIDLMPEEKMTIEKMREKAEKQLNSRIEKSFMLFVGICENCEENS